MINWNDDGSKELIIEEFNTISISPGECRSFKNISSQDGLLQVIISGDIRDMNDIAFTKDAKIKWKK